MRLDEDTLGEAMGRAVGGARPSAQALVEGAARRGRRLRTRRRVTTGIAACAAAGAVAGVSVWGAAQQADDDGMRTPQRPTDVMIPDFSKAPRRPLPLPEGKEPLSARAAAQIVKEALPKGLTTSAHRGSSPDPKEKWRARYPYGTEVQLSLGGRYAGALVWSDFDTQFYLRQKDESGPHSLGYWYSCKRVYEMGRVTSCRVRNLDDGSVMIEHTRRSAESAKEVIHHAETLRLDGTRISAGMSYREDRSGPPLSAAQLRRIVLGDRWQHYVDPGVNDRAKSLKPFRQRNW
ncbi:hypothetical protein [Streptomyces sp. NPDC059063]|uniref:hypothetical protein n=1 Tax=unclassified Streptomyces TaxID=2593676 RepID=UPI0036AAB9E7